MACAATVASGGPRVNPDAIEREYRKCGGEGGDGGGAAEARVQPAQGPPDREPFVDVAAQDDDVRSALAQQIEQAAHLRAPLARQQARGG